MNADEAINAIAERMGIPSGDLPALVRVVSGAVDLRDELLAVVIGAPRASDQEVSIEVNNSIKATVDVAATLVAGRVTAKGQLKGPVRIRVNVAYRSAVAERCLHLRREYRHYLGDAFPRFDELDADVMLLVLGYAQGVLVERGVFTREQVNEHLATGVVPLHLEPLSATGESP